MNGKYFRLVSGHPRNVLVIFMFCGLVFSCSAAGSQKDGQIPQKLLNSLPESFRSSAETEPARFREILQNALKYPELLVLVNKQTLLKPDFTPDDLVELSNYHPPLILNKKGMKLRKPAALALAEMARAAGKDGISLDISSAYRSYEYQTGLFQRNVNELGPKEASRVSARAGASQHQLGTAVDFGSVTVEYARTAAGKWLESHAWKYGFSLSYPKGLEEYTGYSWEPWHYRFIGPSASILEHDYFGGVQEKMMRWLSESSLDINAWLSKP